jgi:HSP20 family protein
MYGIRNRIQANPWGPLERFHAEFERGGLSLAGAAALSAIDVWNDGDDLRLRALVPGIAPDALEITVGGDTVTLRGTLPPVGEKPGDRWLRRERSTGSFARTIQLPFDVDAEGGRATVTNGVLSMELPRSAATKPRRIPVQTQ